MTTSGFLYGSTPTKEDRMYKHPTFLQYNHYRYRESHNYQQMHAHSGSENEKENIRKWWKQDRTARK